MLEYELSIISQSAVTKPDWNFWGKKRSVLLWQAVLLSLDLSPILELVNSYYTGRRFDGTFEANSVWRFEGFRDMQHQARYEIVLNHLDVKESNFVLDRLHKEPAEYSIDLHSFGLWAKKTGLDLPIDFPLGTDISSQSPLVTQNSALFKIELPYITEQLQCVLEAMKLAHASKITDSKTLKSLLETEFEKSNYKTPKVAIEQYAILIRPDDKASKDPRSRKYRQVQTCKSTLP